MGLRPTYAQIGVAAPILLTLLRLVEGFAVGGEWGGPSWGRENSATGGEGFEGLPAGGRRRRRHRNDHGVSSCSAGRRVVVVVVAEAITFCRRRCGDRRGGDASAGGGAGGAPAGVGGRAGVAVDMAGGMQGKESAGARACLFRVMCVIFFLCGGCGGSGWWGGGAAVFFIVFSRWWWLSCCCCWFVVLREGGRRVFPAGWGRGGCMSGVRLAPPALPAFFVVGLWGGLAPPAGGAGYSLACFPDGVT